MKHTILPGLVANNELRLKAVTRTVKHVTPAPRSTKKGQAAESSTAKTHITTTTVQAWQIPHVPVTKLGVQNWKTRTKYPGYGNAIGLGVDFSHLNRRRLRHRKIQLREDAKVAYKLKEERKAGYKAAAAQVQSIQSFPKLKDKKREMKRLWLEERVKRKQAYVTYMARADKRTDVAKKAKAEASAAEGAKRAPELAVRVEAEGKKNRIVVEEKKPVTEVKANKTAGKGRTAQKSKPDVPGAPDKPKGILERLKLW